MAVLSGASRTAIRSELGAEVSARREPYPLTKAQLDAAIAAVDDWVETNNTSYNQALPVAARNALTNAQKVELLYKVAWKRYGVA